MVVLLTLVYSLSYVDRTIIGTVGEAIKQDLRLTDTQLGMLHGLAFSIFYIGLTVPLARLAERVNRVNLIALCIFAWSLCTAALGIVSSFVGLFVTRILVGIGEAGTTPASHSMIADVYAPRERGKAVGTLLMGIPFGMLIGALVAGWATQHFGWRVAFIALGIPGIAIAFVLKSTVKEPPRGWSENKVTSATEAPPAFRAVLRQLLSSAAVVHLGIGKALMTTFIFCAAGFTVSFFIRSFGLTYGEIGLIYGVAVGIGYAVGAIAGALLTDLLPKWDRRWYGWMPMLVLALAGPVYLLAYSQHAWQLAAVLLFVGSALGYASIAPGSVSFHNILEPRTRATAISVLFVVENVLPLAVGPMLLGFLSDQFAASAFSHLGAGDFASACPGGKAMARAGADLVAACARSLAVGTRQSLQLLCLLPLWSAFHYYLHATALPRSR